MAPREMRFTSLLVPGNNIRSGNRFKVLEENIGKKISDIPHSNIFTYMSPIDKGFKGKNKQMGPHQIEKLLHGERKQ